MYHHHHTIMLLSASPSVLETCALCIVQRIFFFLVNSNSWHWHSVVEKSKLDSRVGNDRVVARKVIIHSLMLLMDLNITNCVGEERYNKIFYKTNRFSSWYQSKGRWWRRWGVGAWCWRGAVWRWGRAWSWCWPPRTPPGWSPADGGCWWSCPSAPGSSHQWHRVFPDLELETKPQGIWSRDHTDPAWWYFRSRWRDRAKSPLL